MPVAISAGSRYTASNVYSALSQDGTRTRTLVSRSDTGAGGFVSETTSVSVYQWSAGDRIDSLAFKLLGDSRLYWKIMDLNPWILDPSAITPGTMIWVPRA